MHSVCWSGVAVTQTPLSIGWHGAPLYLMRMKRSMMPLSWLPCLTDVRWEREGKGGEGRVVVQGGRSGRGLPSPMDPFVCTLFCSWTLELWGVPSYSVVLRYSITYQCHHSPPPPFPPQVEVFDLKVIIPLLAEVSQVSRRELAAGGLTIENAHDKVCCLYWRCSH